MLGTSEVTICDETGPQQSAVKLIKEHDHNMVEISEICGYAVGHDPIYLDKFCTTFVESLFSALRICDRIDYFHQADLSKFEKSVVIRDTVLWGLQDNAFFIRDLDRQFLDLNLVLLRQTEGDISSYAIRWYDTMHHRVPLDPKANLRQVIGKTIVKDNREFCHCIEGFQDVFWNFRRCNCGCGVQVLRASEAVMDPRLTRMAAYFVCWASNVLGFEGLKKK